MDSDLDIVRKQRALETEVRKRTCLSRGHACYNTIQYNTIQYN